MNTILKVIIKPERQNSNTAYETSLCSVVKKNSQTKKKKTCENGALILKCYSQIFFRQTLSDQFSFYNTNQEKIQPDFQLK